MTKNMLGIEPMLKWCYLHEAEEALNKITNYTDLGFAFDEKEYKEIVSEAVQSVIDNENPRLDRFLCEIEDAWTSTFPWAVIDEIAEEEKDRINKLLNQY